MHKTSWIVVATVLVPAAVLAADTGITPGQWEIASTVISMEMPGAPAGVAAMMTGKTTTIRHCITPEEATRGPQDMLKSNKACSFTHYSMMGGKLESAMTCKQGGGTMTATSSGNFTPTGFTSTGRSVMSGGGMPMTITNSVVGRRVGACK